MLKSNAMYVNIFLIFQGRYVLVSDKIYPNISCLHTISEDDHSQRFKFVDSKWPISSALCPIFHRGL